MSYMQKLEQLAQTNLDIGFNAGFQAATDLWMLALAQGGCGAQHTVWHSFIVSLDMRGETSRSPTMRRSRSTAF